MNELRDIFTKYKAVVFFDTETTGLEAESCQIMNWQRSESRKPNGAPSAWPTAPTCS